MNSEDVRHHPRKQASGAQMSQEQSQLSQQSDEELATFLIDAYEATSQLDKTAPLLRAMLQFAPTDQGRQNMAKDIVRFANDLHGVAEYYQIMFLMILAKGGRTAQPSSIPTPLDESETGNNANGIYPQGREPSFRERLLRRDGHRCTITGYYSFDDYSRLSQEQRDELQLSGITELDTSYVDAAHIFPFGLASFNEDQSLNYRQIWWKFIRFYPELGSGLKASKINDTENGLTMTTMLHQSFGKMKFCLAETDIPNTYNVETFPGNRGTPGDITQLLQQHRSVRLLPQDGRYRVASFSLLKLHRAVANVCHAAGMAEVLDRILHETYNIRCLAEDGSTDIERLIRIQLACD